MTLLKETQKDCATDILAAHESNGNMWEITEDEKNGSLVDEEDLVCCYLIAHPLDEFEFEYLIDSDELLDEDCSENVGVSFQIPSPPNFHLKNKSNNKSIVLDVSWTTMTFCIMHCWWIGHQKSGIIMIMITVSEIFLMG